MKKVILLILAAIMFVVVVLEYVMFNQHSRESRTSINKSVVRDASVSGIKLTVKLNMSMIDVSKATTGPSTQPPSQPPPNLKPTYTGLSPSTVPLLPTPDIFTSSWATTYEPTTMLAMCYVKVHNICVNRGELIFYYPKSIIKKYKPVFYKGGTKNTLVPAQTSKNKGNIGLCNEGIRKGSPDVQFRIEKERSGPPEGWEVVEDRELNLLHCWEYVGYHLWYCLIGIYLRYERHNSDFINTKRDIAMTTVSGMGDTIRLGSPSNWTQTSRGRRPRDNSKYWPLWKSVIDKPSLIWVLYDRQHPVCYKSAILGSPNPYSVTADEWKGFLIAFKKQMQLPERRLRDRSSSEYKILVVERKSSYKILNLPEVMESMKMISTNTQLVMWEEIEMMEQLRIAADSDIIIGTHGNGLTWSALLPFGGSIIELWPGESYNGNYITIANKTGLHHFQLSHGKNQKRKTRFDYLVDIPKLTETVKLAIQFMTTKDPNTVI
eukprot:TRINITY_DN4419_c2_g1_i1.p1 TRINITY_DN4419_c2_g1~~TRINITY_DN4419_c2_g1_i1.p1  ORF type:complete len:491 (+),score=90.27 TRINITY_DN4419_c2_g1_i1:94-1566(+)